MSKITNIDAVTCKIVRERINAALRELGEELGLRITAGNARYGAQRIDFKLEASLANPLVPGETPEGRAFKALASHYGLSSADLGKTFINQGRIFKITGLNANRPKFPISAEEVRTRKGYKFPAYTVRDALAREKRVA